MGNRELVRECIKGNATAQRELYDVFAPKMLSLCHRYAKSTNDARDVFQEGFLKVLENLHKLKDLNSLEWWMKRIFVNEAFKLYNRNKPITLVEDITLEFNNQTDDFNILENIGTAEITTLIQRLPYKMRFTFNMYVIEGYSHKEIGEILNVSEGTSKSNLHTGTLAAALITTFIYFEIKTHPNNNIADKHIVETKALPIEPDNHISPEKDDGLKEKRNNITYYPGKDSSDNIHNFPKGNVSGNLKKAVKEDKTIPGVNYSDSQLSASNSNPDSLSDKDIEAAGIHAFQKINSVNTDNLIRGIDVTDFKKTAIQKQDLIIPLSYSNTGLKIKSGSDSLNPVLVGEQYSKPDAPLIIQTDQNLQYAGNSDKKKVPLIRTRYYIEPFFSPEISYRALAVNKGYSREDYNKAYFNARDRVDFTFSTGINAGYLLSDKITLKSGLFYSQYRQKFKTEAVYVLHDNITGYYMYTSSGVANLSIVSSDTVSIDSFIKSSIRFDYINLPLIIAFRIASNYTLNLGINFNYIISHSLNWQSKDFIGDQSQSDKITGTNSGNISLIAGLEIEKPLTEKIKLIINPSINVQLTSLSSTSPVKTYPYSWGLHTGLRYYF